MADLLRRAGRAFDRLLFPRAATCMGCGDQSGCEQDWVCDECVEALAKLWCGGAPLPCVPPIERLFSAYFYRDPVAALVQALKYGSVGKLSEPMAQSHGARHVPVFALPDATLVVPAPMHPRRERHRGYNQAELLSQEVARRLGCAHARALKKVRNTRQQARLDHAARAENLKDSVIVCEDVRGSDGIAGGRRIHHRCDHARLRRSAARRRRGVGLWADLRLCRTCAEKQGSAAGIKHPQNTAL